LIKESIDLIEDKKELLLHSLKTVQNLASGAKLTRFTHNPVRYLYCMLIRLILYPITHKSFMVKRLSFFGVTMNINLPAGSDIYLTGGKTHDSEIRLAKYLILKLGNGDLFLDIGAHLGYFSLLAKNLVGSTGRVVAIEAAPSTFNLLETNTKNTEIVLINSIVSSKNASVSFYEFPALYSEYNSMEIEGYKSESWFKKYPPKEHFLNAYSLDSLLKELDFKPQIIKIDVEGAEPQVIAGAKEVLKEKPIIIMEILTNSTSHEIAISQLLSDGFKMFRITDEGHVNQSLDWKSEMNFANLHSDNYVFINS